MDPKKSDQVVRGSVVLPAGTGKTVRVAVFASGEKAEQAKAAGADIVGMEDLAERVKAGDMPFDIVIASPDTMRIVGTLGQILGPRGLMPNPKVGTVTPDVATAVKNAKAGQVQYRTDKAGIIHATIGRKSFSDADLKSQPGCPDRSTEQGQASYLEGRVPAQGRDLVDDGRRRSCRPRFAGCLSIKNQVLVPAMARGASLGWSGVRKDSGQAIKDRWAEGSRSGWRLIDHPTQMVYPNKFC